MQVSLPSHNFVSQFNMVAELALETIDEITERENNQDKNENKENEYEDNKKKYDENKQNVNKQEETQIMVIYRTESNTIGKMQKMNIKLPSPTQFDGNILNSMNGLEKSKRPQHSQCQH
eukprot:3411586-Amphidinium_carterae.2